MSAACLTATPTPAPACSSKGDVVTIEETWKFDKQNKLVGRYNFTKEEAVFKYEHTRGTLKLAAEYNLQVGQESNRVWLARSVWGAGRWRRRQGVCLDQQAWSSRLQPACIACGVSHWLPRPHHWTPALASPSLSLPPGREGGGERREEARQEHVCSQLWRAGPGHHAELDQQAAQGGRQLGLGGQRWQ